MYALMDSNWEVYGLYRDMRVALAELNTSPFALTLINNVTGEILYNNWDR